VDNSIDSEPGRTRNETNVEEQESEHHQRFPMGSMDSAMSKNSQRRELRLFARRPFKKFGVVAFNYLISNGSLNQVRLVIF